MDLLTVLIEIKVRGLDTKQYVTMSVAQASQVSYVDVLHV